MFESDEQVRGGERNCYFEASAFIGEGKEVNSISLVGSSYGSPQHQAQGSAVKEK